MHVADIPGHETGNAENKTVEWHLSTRAILLF